MELKDFIKASIQDVVDALVDIDNDLENKRRGIKSFPDISKTINNENQLSKTDYLVTVMKDEFGRDSVSTVISFNFDVAITTEDASTKEGKAALKIANIIDIGGNASGENRNSSISRIQFKIPIKLPDTGNYINNGASPQTPHSA